MTSPLYIVPPGFQLRDGGATGPVDCTAWACRVVIAASTGGLKVPSGRRIRLLTDEAIPNPKSPGLNIPQVADVAWEHYGVYLEQRTGRRAMPWEEYEERRKAGEPMLVQLDYGPIADSAYDAGRGFRGGHAIAETQHSTYDSLADGRVRTVWKHDGRIYPRSLIREAAGELVIGNVFGRDVKVGDGKVWCAVGRDTAPEFRVVIRPRKGRDRRAFRVFHIVAGRISEYDVRRTREVLQPCDPPRAFRWPTKDDQLRYLVRIREGRYAGKLVARHWAREV